MIFHLVKKTNFFVIKNKNYDYIENLNFELFLKTFAKNYCKQVKDRNTDDVCIRRANIVEY